MNLERRLNDEVEARISHLEATEDQYRKSSNSKAEMAKIKSRIEQLEQSVAQTNPVQKVDFSSVDDKIDELEQQIKTLTIKMKKNQLTQEDVDDLIRVKVDKESQSRLKDIEQCYEDIQNSTT